MQRALTWNAICRKSGISQLHCICLLWHISSVPPFASPLHVTQPCPRFISGWFGLYSTIIFLGRPDDLHESRDRHPRNTCCPQWSNPLVEQGLTQSSPMETSRVEHTRRWLMHAKTGVKPEYIRVDANYKMLSWCWEDPPIGRRICQGYDLLASPRYQSSLHISRLILNKSPRKFEGLTSDFWGISFSANQINYLPPSRRLTILYHDLHILALKCANFTCACLTPDRW